MTVENILHYYVIGIEIIVGATCGILALLGLIIMICFIVNVIKKMVDGEFYDWTYR